MLRYNYCFICLHKWFLLCNKLQPLCIDCYILTKTK